ncbi:MAG: ribonuclease E/G [Butyrivibrio sp.]|uniref:Ribonuclease G n=1 Tax=Butyrivibrio hungatei TaxID=185008 RepID=A0A1G5AX59_9FIRM|nr:ribonuclease E/G [Butyrivibrio hungatei]MBQ2609506.1 ribonuclease E/G [Butyrivibrio sp.]MBQ4220605.1 ribonuclease E/G [Butyrivibrio sp.]MBR4358545.1 ribonuclease E/G [Butyrivibrio sp.]MBR4639923.1 ribonuclease E/G [Butyrivibrio sp.]SCX82458.1 ribonuclease G [Butyrivibrio hungatei]
MSEIIISEYLNTPVVTAFIGNKMEYLSFVRDNELGNIYVAKVDHIVKNINAAFVRYDKDKTGYLPLKNITGACVINRKFTSDDTLKNGDDVIVQVESEAVKTKKTKLTTNLSVSDNYVAVTLGKYGVGSSIKLSDDIRTFLSDKIKEDYENIMDAYHEKLSGATAGIIIRTQASEIEEEKAFNVIEDSFKSCLDELAKILSDGRNRTTYSCIHRSDNGSTAQHIENAEAFLKVRGESDYSVIEDTGIHGIRSAIDDLKHRKVWLKSGAYIIIEQLESFNAIDVNTGKAIKGKDDIAFKVNLEAVNEIFRQIRLRNLTGMILIDFINMDDDEKYEELIHKVKAFCKYEQVHTCFIDVTGLGIMELTRNKNDKTLKEILKDVEKAVDNSIYQ